MVSEVVLAPSDSIRGVSIRSDRTYRFEQPPETIWAALSSVDQYTTWWPWLRAFDGTRLGVGERWHCVVKPQVPYTVEFDLELTEVVEFRQAGAELSGEISGRADLTLEAEGAGCRLRLVSELAADHGPARLVERFVPFVASAGHDWVLDTGIRQFRRRALDR